MSGNISQFIKSLSSHDLISWSGPAFRMHNPVWAWSPMSCEGAKRAGGRFNPKGSPALYLGLKVNTCLAEVSAGTSTKLLDPQVLCSYSINIDGLLDLRPYHELFSSPWRLLRLQGGEPPGWQLYKAVEKRPEIKGFLVPSYQAEKEDNLVLLHWRHQEVKLHDPDGTMAAVYGDKFNVQPD
ncbi:MAG: RES domain-containing protein [Phenylobacterium sp.]|jgi:RES domain-containing protein